MSAAVPVRVLGAGGAAALALASWWALGPLGPPPGETVGGSAAAAPDPPGTPARQSVVLDVAAFGAPLWVAPPPPPPPPKEAPPPPPPPPLRLQLLAVIQEGPGVRTAMLYDPDTDALLIVAAGERIGGRSVEAVTDDGVTIRDRAGVRSLSLTTEGSGGRR